MSDRSTSRYLLFTDENVLCGWRNVNTGEVKMAKQPGHFYEKAFNGIHVINRKLFMLMQPLFSGKFSMIDVYLELAKTLTVHGFADDNCLFVDVGKPESIAVAETLFQ